MAGDYDRPPSEYATGGSSPTTFEDAPVIRRKARVQIGEVRIAPGQLFSVDRAPGAAGGSNARYDPEP